VVNKKKIESQAVAYLRQVFRDGDWRESLAAFYAAAQVVEREMMSNMDVDPEYLLEVQLLGKRIGAMMGVAVKKEDVN